MKKNLYSFLVGLTLVLSPGISWATHLMGLDISYECTGSCTYRVYSNIYYDCTGSASSSYIPVSMANAPNPASEMSGFGFESDNGACPDPSPIGPWTIQSFVEVTPICPSLLSNPANHPTGCLSTTGNPIINGSAEAIFYRDYDFCNVGAACTKYNLTYGSCCRNGAITSGASNDGLYTGDTQIDLSITPCNSSPRFINPVSGESVPPIAYICEGQLSTFNQGAFDPDGDSLAYELGPCSDGAFGQVDYDVNNGFAPQAPLGPTWDVSINPLTGDLTFDPSPTGTVQVGVLCIVVREFRNGVQIGQVVRDVQVTVLPAGLCPFPNPSTGGVQNVTVGSNNVGSVSYDQVAVCAGAEVCFDIPTIPADTSLNYTMYWGGNLPGATFVDANNPAVTDTISGQAPTGRFCWTPPPGFRGTYFMLVTLKDDACPIPGINQFTIVINVFDGESAFTTAYDRLGCNEVELSVVPNNNIPGFSPDLVDVEWYGNGNLEFNPNTFDSSFIHFYPAPDTYFYSVLVTDELGCTTTLTGIVPLTTGAIADAGQDVTICSNNPFTLGAPTIPGQTYTWTPSVNLSDTNVAEPNFTFINNSDTTATFNYVLEVSDTTCTTFDYVNISVNAAVEASILPANPSICPGDSITLRAVPNIGTATSTQFLWSNGDTSETITLAPTENTTYSVVIFSDSAGGCASLPTDVEVSINDFPTANITGDLKVCPGGSTVLTASGGASYEWSTGQTGSSITFANFTGGDTLVSVIPTNSQGCQGTPDTVRLTSDVVPEAFFDNSTACLGGITEFRDSSTISSGNIVSWEWNFGDGSNLSNEENPGHTYRSDGAYFTSLIVTSDNGCSDQYLREVVVQPSPQVDFNFEDVCQGVASQFTSNTSIANPGNIDQYYWDFGDGSLDSGFQVTHDYAEFGFYNVSLRVVSDEGCSNTFVQTTKIHPNPAADFALQSACEDTTTFFTNLATVPGDFDFVAEWAWDFGDPNSGTANNSSAINPGHAYDEGGNYTINMAVTTDKGCVDQISKEITINPHPVADFVYDQTCENEQTLFEANVSAGQNSEILNYIWDLGNGQTRERSRRAQTIYQMNGGAGVYEVTLVAVATGNCTDTARKQVVINPQPSPDFEVPPVCLYDSSQFTNLSTIASGSIDSWIYEFGDASSVFGANPSHLYFEPGTYQVTLTTVSDSGCSNSVKRISRVWEEPAFTFFQNDTVCFGDQAQLLAVSDPEHNITWHLDKNTQDVVSTGNSFITAPMPFTSTYFVQATSSKGCRSDRFPVTALVRDAENFDMFVSDNVVEMPQALVNFAVGSTVEIEDYRWDFGDGNFSTSSDPSHEYNAPGLFEVTLQIVDRYGCEITLQDAVEVKRISTIEVASAFSPNNDGINENFFIRYYNVSNISVQIFNRTGQLVYETTDPNFRWDGTHEGRVLQEGVYVYVVSGNDLDGNDISEVGTVTLLR